MQEPILMPTLSDTMESGKLIQWLKQPGDVVKKGDVLAEMETDKAVMDVEAFHDGYLLGPLAAAESDIPVGTVIGYISDTPQKNQQAGATAEVVATAKEAVREAQRASPPSNRTTAKEKTSIQTTHPVVRPEASVPTVTDPSGVKSSPYARGLAHELGVDLNQARAGADGVIRASQVLAAALAGPGPNLEAGPAYRYKLFTSMHKAVADNMIAAVATPTFRINAHLPLAPLKALAHAQQLSLTLLLARACALCVQQHPNFNAVYTARALAVRKQVDVGIAVDVPGGLLTPVLRDAAQRPIAELNEDWRILRDKIKRNRLGPNDYQGATFYLSNLGMFEQVSHFDAIIPLGAAAILSLGAEQEGRAEFTLSCDHRVVFGADAARFLQTLALLLNEPKGLGITATSASS